MKRIFPFGVFLVLCGCMGITAESGKLSGTFVAEYSNRFGTTWDTLVLKPLAGKNMYHLIRSQRSEVVVDGKASTEYKPKPPVISEYKPEQRILSIDGLSSFAVDPDGGTLTKGKVTFHKIK